MARRGIAAPLATFAAATTLALAASLVAPPAHGPGAAAPTQPMADSSMPQAVAAADPAPFVDAMDPWSVTLGGKLSRWAWTAAGSAPTEAEPNPASAPEIVAEAPAAPAPAPAEAEAPRTAMTVPLPVPRPPELRGNAVRRAARAPVQQQAALPPPTPEDNRSFLEKLFGVETPPARSYVALDSKPVDPTPRPRLSPPVAPPVGEGGTATYDISARIVTLPSGERLEAHSGLGEIMDDPRHVHVRMRGATPPGTYVLSEREQPFHGVRAIRLTPVGGAESIYGRVGLLAHTFMLGPTGASNGCVSFRDYNRFLEAYLRGEIRQLVVVPGAGAAPSNVAGGPLRVANN